MFKLTVEFNVYVGGSSYIDPVEYLYESCDYLGISEVTVSDARSYLWTLIFDNEEDRALFFEQRPKRVKSLEQVKKHEEHLARRRAKYKENKEREKDDDR